MDNPKDFLVNLINNKYISLNTLEKSINSFDCKISNLENINFEYKYDKLKIIITNNILELTLDNFNYIKSKSLDLLVLFINLNKEYYIENCDDFDIEDIANELVENIELDEDIKSILFENEVIKNTMLNVELLFNLAYDDKYNLRSDVSNDLIFSSNIEDSKKYSYLNKIKEEINIEVTNNYLCMINNDFDYIGVGNNNFSIDVDQNLLEILQKLKSENVISSFVLTKRNKIMVYNRKK